jgi:hypothetical protein
MSVHNWTRVGAGIFHAFHHSWIEEISRALNHGLLPSEYYALPEQHAAGFGPDVLTLARRPRRRHRHQKHERPEQPGRRRLARSAQTETRRGDGTGLLSAQAEFRHRSPCQRRLHRRDGGDCFSRQQVEPQRDPLVRGKGGGAPRTRDSLADRGLAPAGPARPAHGIHAEIWEEIAGEESAAAADKPLTLAAYESDFSVRAYFVPVAVGDALTAMPLFLEPGKAVEVPLEETYCAAFAAVPRRWQRVLETPNA